MLLIGCYGASWSCHMCCSTRRWVSWELVCTTHSSGRGSQQRVLMDRKAGDRSNSLYIVDVYRNRSTSVFTPLHLSCTFHNFLLPPLLLCLTAHLASLTGRLSGSHCHSASYVPHYQCHSISYRSSMPISYSLGPHHMPDPLAPCSVSSHRRLAISYFFCSSQSGLPAGVLAARPRGGP